MSGVLANITALQGFNNSKLVVDKPVIVEDFDWGGIFVYKSGDLPPGIVGINSGINPGFHWVDLVGNFVVNYAANNLATQNHTHDSTQITDLNSWGVGWLPTQSIDASQIVNLVFPPAPVDSVNGQTGIVNLTAADVGAIASGSITITTTEITDWETAFQSEFASLIVGAVIDFSQITNIPLESPVNWDDVESKPTFLLDFEALSISALQGFLYHSGVDIWELRESLAIADITNLQTTIDGKQASHPSLSALSTIGDNANTGYFKKTGLNSWQVTDSIAWGELSGIPVTLGVLGVATLTGDGLLRRDGGTWLIAPQIDWGELGNIPANLGEMAAIATAGYLKRAADGSIEAVEDVVKPPRPGTWEAIATYEVGDVPIIVVPENLTVNQRYISFSTDEAININIYIGVGEPPDLSISPPKYTRILRPGTQISDDDFFHNGQAIWAVTPASTQVLNVQIAPAAIDYTGAEDLSNYQDKAGKGQPLGYAGLDANSKILQANIPAIAIVDTYVVTTELEMLGLTAEVGDVAIRTDSSISYILQGSDPGLLTDWQELLSPGEVSSVNGQVGTVLINNISGNAATATTLETPRIVSSSGDITWDVTFDGSSNVDGVAAITANVVNNSKLATMTAGTIKGSELGGNPQDLTASQVLGIINVETGATANSTDAALLARANHTGTQFASTISDFDAEVANNTAVAANTAKTTNATHIGEVTGDTALTITDGAVSNLKLADMAEATIKGRVSLGVGDPEDLTSIQIRTLLNVEDGATANSTDAALLNRANHTGTQIGTTVSYDNVASGLTAGEVQGAIDELDGILDNLVVGTDVQAFSAELEAIAGLTSSANQLPLFTGLGTASLLPISAYVQGLLGNADAATARGTLGLGDAAVLNAGVANGVATLDSGGKIPTGQLPASVDEILEYANLAAFPLAGEASKIYVTLDNNLTYRWSGSDYVEISASLALGTTASTAYQGDLGQIAYTHTSLTTNPHSVTASQVGLGNVDNTSDANKPISTAAQSALNAKQSSDTELTALAGLTSSANQLPYFTGSGTAALTTLSAYGRTLIDDADATTARTTLGLGTIAIQNANAIAITGGSIAGISDLAVADGGTGASTATAARTNLKAIGSDATGITGASEIANIVALTQANYDAIVTPDAGTIYNITDAATLDLAGNTTISTFGATLVDDGDAAAARATLGLGDAAVLNAAVANGVATLDGSGKVLTAQLPSYVDDVLEFANLAGFPGTGEAGKIYVAQDTNLTYRWSGSAYVEISASLALGTTSSTAYQGDLGQIAYNHTSLTTNPHSVTAAQVGLGNVNNTSDLAKPISTATQSALDAKQASDAELSALAGLASAANQLPYFIGPGTAALTALSPFGRTLIDDADAAAAKTTLGIAFGTTAGTFAEGDNFLQLTGGTVTGALTVTTGLTVSSVDITPEEGTFTPVVAGSTTAGTGTYSKQVGIYRKIGKTTYVSIRLAWSAHTGTGDMRINGLPFASENVTDFIHSLNVAAPTGLTVPTDHLPYAVILANTSYIAMVSRPTTGGSLTQPYLALDTAVTDLVICGVYISA